jgi:hypothetical protein
VGYQNNLATHRIEPDPQRAPIIHQLFEWYASGEYSLKALTKKAAAAGLTNRTGGTPLVEAKIHQLCSLQPIVHVRRSTNTRSPDRSKPYVDRMAAIREAARILHRLP